MKREKLRRDEFEPYAPPAPGQIHINHEDCPAGVDTKRRLYIRRKENGSDIVAFCHHCSKSGYVHQTGLHPRETHPPTEGDKRNSCQLLIRDIVSYSRKALPRDEIIRWPREGKQWVTKYLSADEIHKYGISYSDESKRIILPIMHDGNIVGAQGRAIFTGQNPKYLTQFVDSDWKYKFSSYSSNNHILVLTEDILSAIIIREVVEESLDTVALLTSNIREDLIEYVIHKNYRKVLIFLDNDNHTVRKHQRSISTRLNPICSQVTIVKQKDPKNMNRMDLKKELTRCTI